MAKLNIKNISLRGIAACVPKNRLRSKDMSIYSTEEEYKRFIDSTGIESRRVADLKICASDLCYEASERLITELGWNKNDIEALVFSSTTPDYRMPMTSCILQNKLGLPQSCFTLDIPVGCCGYLHGITVLSNLMSSGSIKKGLLLVGDTPFRTASPEDKSRLPIAGDAGTASAFEYNSNAGDIISYSYSDGSGYDAIIAPHSGFRHPVTPESFIMEDIAEGIRRAPVHAILNGMDVFAFTLSKPPKLLKDFLIEQNLDKDKDIDYYLLHQANKLINDRMLFKAKIDIRKAPHNIEEFGNTGGATIPLLMITRIREDLIYRPLHLILLAFGVGLVWGCVYLKTDGVICPELMEI